MKKKEAYTRLVESGVRPSVQRLAIMDYLIKHPTHPTIDDVYQALCEEVPTLSRTTVYNTLRMLSEKHAAQMITIDDHVYAMTAIPTVMSISTASIAVRSSTSSTRRHHH